LISILIGKKKAGKIDLACPRVRTLDGINKGVIHPYRSADKTLEEQRFSCFCLTAGSYIHTRLQPASGRTFAWGFNFFSVKNSLAKKKVFCHT